MMMHELANFKCTLLH